MLAQCILGGFSWIYLGENVFERSDINKWKGNYFRYGPDNVSSLHCISTPCLIVHWCYLQPTSSISGGLNSPPTGWGWVAESEHSPMKANLFIWSAIGKSVYSRKNRNRPSFTTIEPETAVTVRCATGILKPPPCANARAICGKFFLDASEWIRC